MEEGRYRSRRAHVVFISTQHRNSGKGLSLQQAIYLRHVEKLSDSLGYMTRRRDYQRTLWNRLPTVAFEISYICVWIVIIIINKIGWVEVVRHSESLHSIWWPVCQLYWFPQANRALIISEMTLVSMVKKWIRALLLQNLMFISCKWS